MIFFVVQLLMVLGTILTSTASTNTTRRRLTLTGQPGVASSSICFQSDGTIVPGPVDCPDGEAHLLGQYINLGIHNAGSFGTKHQVDAAYSTSKLAILADFDRNGFLPTTGGQPGFAGDFSLGPLVEGEQPILYI